MENILITGSNGFIGKHIVNKFTESDIKFIEFKEDINVSDNYKIYKDCKISRVLHVAGKTFVPESWEYPAKYYFNNTFGTLNVLEFCKEEMIPLTYISAYLYGVPDELPLTEKTILNPNNPYAHSKYLAEQLCEFYSNVFNVPVTIIRPFNVYGKGQNEKFLIPSIINQVLYKDVITVKDLQPRRDYVYVEDLVNALISTFTYNKMFSIFNIASGKSYTVKEIIDIIQNVAGTSKKIISDGVVRKNEINNIEVDISEATSKLHWHPTTGIEQGVLEIINGKGADL